MHTLAFSGLLLLPKKAKQPSLKSPTVNVHREDKGDREVQKQKQQDKTKIITTIIIEINHPSKVIKRYKEKVDTL